MVEIAYTTQDLLDSRMKALNISDYNPSALVAALQNDLNNATAKISRDLAMLCETTQRQYDSYPTSETGADWQPLDAHGKAAGGVVRPGQIMGWPLNRFGDAIVTDRQYRNFRKPYDLLVQQQDVENRYQERVYLEMKKGIYAKGAYTFVDEHYDFAPISVKGWLDSDGWKIPNAVDGSKFDPTSHDHYAVAAALSNTVVQARVDDIAHHPGAKGLEIHIPLSMKAAFSALTDFKALDLSIYAQNPSTDFVTGAKLNPNADPNNQWIGWWTPNQIPVYTRPYCQSGYFHVFALGGYRKPLMRRVHPLQSMVGMRYWAKTTDESWFEDQIEDFMGFAPAMREFGTVCFIDAGGVYVAPTFAA